MIAWIAARFGWSLFKAKAISATFVAALAIMVGNGLYKGLERHFVTKERASVQKKGEKIGAKAAQNAKTADIEKALRSICRDC